jgi:hypothetical protein
MSQVTQKQAVYVAILSVLKEHNVHFEDGMNVAPLMSKDYRAIVNTILFEGFRSGSIQLDSQFTDQELKSYVSGLQSNWIRKDARLNGDTKYVAKNPGSRTGSGDAQIKAMKALLSTLTTDEDKAEVQAAIDARVAEIESLKPKVSIDFSSLPESLRAKFVK